jgi:hypothetical protein
MGGSTPRERLEDRADAVVGAVLLVGVRQMLVHRAVRSAQ